MTATPRRTCVVCRQVRPKGELVRLARLGDGSVAVDARGRMMGRGAYVCRGPECAGRLARTGRLSQAFRRPTTIEPGLGADVMKIDLDATSRR